MDKGKNTKGLLTDFVPLRENDETQVSLCVKVVISNANAAQEVILGIIFICLLYQIVLTVLNENTVKSKFLKWNTLFVMKISE